MPYFVLLLVFVTFTNCQAISNDRAKEGSWPRPENICGFFPYDGESGTNDYVNGIKPSRCFSPKLRSDLQGPFGSTSTSYGVGFSPAYICGYDQVVKSLSFTYAFYYYYEQSTVADKKLNAIMVNAYPAVISVAYVSGDGLEITSYGEEILTVKNILKPKQWNFIALSYDNDRGKLTIYKDEAGSKAIEKDIKLTPPLVTGSQTFFTGLHYYGGEAGLYSNMRAEDALACVFAYSTVLEDYEIALLPGVCQTKGQGPTPSTKSTTTSTTTTTTKPPAATVWPQASQLLAFLPLSYEYRLEDVGPNQFKATQSSNDLIPVSGPFGTLYTAAKATATPTGTNGLVSVNDARLSLAGGNSFTVSLFFSLGNPSEGGGLFEFIDSAGSKKPFQFRYVNATHVEVSANEVTIGQYLMIQQKGVWTFAAFTWDGSKFTVYSRHGVLAPAESKPEIQSSMSTNNNGIRLGYASQWGQTVTTSDSFACLMVYKTALTAEEVRQAYFSCRIMGGSIPCGTPKLPYSPVPAATTATSIPKVGQFPWISSLRLDNKHICSATIIDAFWLLTASSCFSGSDDASKYVIYVAEQDLAVDEPFTSKHQVVKFFTNGPVALVHLLEPIDFRTDYVNDACWLQGGDRRDLDLQATQFVMGWGENGRSPLISQTLPRYVPGAILPTSQCEQSWGDEFDAKKDYCFQSASTDKNVPCAGDEGSPVLVQAYAKPNLFIGERLVQLGIYYKRDATCSAAKPGLFANLANYAEWIAENLACAVPGVSYPPSCPQK